MSSASLHDYLRDHCQLHDVWHYLEIGVREGDSLRVVVENGHALQSVWLSDTWGGEYGGTNRGSHWHIEKLLDEFPVLGRIAFLDGDSRVTIPALMPQKANAFDLVLVDGDHSAAGAMADLQNVWPLVRPDGCVVFHDTNHPAHPELRQVFDSFVAQHRAPHLVNDAGYGLGVAWKN